MKYILRALVLTFGLLLGGGNSQGDVGSKWLVAEIDTIGTASADILEAALEEVTSGGYQGLVMELDTPGGALDSTRTMVKAIMSAPFPVVVWVGPNGARAGSAGAFITISGHIAAMAPGTNIGAAHPVQASGKDIEQKDMREKIENDTASFMESIAEARGRNKDMAVSFVVNSLSISAKDALEHNIIDVVAEDKRALFESVRGKEVVLTGGVKVKLPEQVPEFVNYERTAKQKFLSILSNPNLFYLLFLGGLIGIGFELTHPGSLIPGVLGAISLLLALIAMAVLPVNFGALLLILASIGFMVAEVFLPSFGILGIGGIVAFVIGSFLLVDPGNEQGLQISFWAIAPATLGVVGFGGLIGYLVVRIDRANVVSGAEGMIGQHGRARHDFVEGKGQVFTDGEHWTALAMDGETILADDQVDVVARDGLTLTVKKREKTQEEEV